MHIEKEKFGKDHWSLLAYVETRCIDYKGVLALVHLRSMNRALSGMEWKPEWGTRLSGFWNDDGTTNPDLKLPEHDDFDCLDDLEEAGYIKSLGTGLNPAYKLTKEGVKVCSKLRQHKSAGKHFSQFKIGVPTLLSTPN